MALLAKDSLNIRIFPPKGCQLFLRDFNIFPPILEPVPFAEFFSQQLQFALRTPGKFRVRTITFAPAAINVGVAHTDIKGVESYLDLGSFNGWVTHGLAPVVEVIHACADPRLDLCCPFAHGMRNEIVVEGIVERENASHPELGVVLKRGGRKREQKQNE